MAVEATISITPKSPFVAMAEILPNPMAGVAQAKNRKSVVAKVCEFIPSLKSET
jgi:hypothetical protein